MLALLSMRIIPNQQLCMLNVYYKYYIHLFIKSVLKENFGTCVCLWISFFQCRSLISVFLTAMEAEPSPSHLQTKAYVRQLQVIDNQNLLFEMASKLEPKDMWRDRENLQAICTKPLVPDPINPHTPSFLIVTAQPSWAVNHLRLRLQIIERGHLFTKMVWIVLWVILCQC